MTPISALIAAKACISMSEAHELHKEYDRAIQQAAQAILYISNWANEVRLEKEREGGYRGADITTAMEAQYRADNREGT